MIFRIVMLTGVAVVVLMGLLALPAMAQVDSEAVVDMKYFDFFVIKGGWITFVLIALSIVTIALAIEHAVSIRRKTVVPAETLDHTHALISEKKYLEAIRYSAEDQSMLGHTLHTALVEAANGFEAMERAVEESLDDRSARLFRKTEYLNIIGNISPMIGLFGTVVGMILLFAEIHAADAFPPARVVADRIAVALITTFWGLAVAIPALSIHAIFRNRIDVLTAECAIAAQRILDVFKPGAAAPAAVPAPARSEVPAGV